MKLNFILILTSFLSLSLNAQSVVDKEISKTSVDSSFLHGRWHLVETILTLDNTNGLGSKAVEAHKNSSESQRKVKKQIQKGELAIITQFNYDGTYTHELVDADPALRFPRYRESGTWEYEPETNKLTRTSKDQEITTLSRTKVKKLNQNELVLELKYNEQDYEGLYKGLTETVYLKKVRETKTNIISDSKKEVSEESPTWTYTYLKSKQNYKSELKKTIFKNWFVMDSIAKEKGLIKSYELIENINQGESTEWDFIVAVEYFTQGNYSDIAEEFEKIRESHKTIKINGLPFGEVGTVVKSELVKKE